MTLIGLSSPASRSGKDTVAGILCELYGFEQRALADPIRDILLKMDPYVPDIEPRLLSSALEQYGWDGVKKHFPDVVEWMIALGQGVRDHIHPAAWVNAALMTPYTNLVVSDVRHWNEAEEIKIRGGVLWQIIRPGAPVRGMDDKLGDWKFDLVIYNNGSLIDLEEQVQQVYESTIGI